MAIMKKKDIDWKYYLTEIARSQSKLSEIEKQEFAGHLLKRDMESTQKRYNVIEDIAISEDCYLGDMIASFLVAESPDTIEDLLNTIKKIITDFYTNEINELIINEEKFIQDEKNNGV